MENKAQRWYRTQLEFLSNVDNNGFAKMFIAGLPEYERIVKIPDELKHLPVGHIVHAKTNKEMTDFKDWELT